MSSIEILWNTIPLTCREFVVTEKLNAVSTATVRFDESIFLHLGSINYLDEIVIGARGQEEPLFTGNIISVKKELNTQIVVHLANGVELTETGVSSLTIMGSVDIREIFYSMTRLSGWSKDRIHIPGLDTSMKEMAAFVPFKGLIEKEETVGGVQFLSLKKLREHLPRTEKSETWNTFLDADGWIFFRFTATHFSDAEELAIERADTFFSTYSSLLQYSYSQFNEAFIEWERTRSAINLKRQSHMLLVMLRTGGAWLRDLSPYKPIQIEQKPTINMDIEAIIHASENFQLPLLIWNRFRDSEDYYIITIGLWQVFELLSSGVKLPRRFSKEQLHNVSSRVAAHLTEQERKPVQDAVNKLNQRSLMEKFEQHLKDIGLVLSNQDSELLRMFRDIRNAIEHGRKPEEPSVQDIKRVKALTNRILLASLKHASASSIH